MNDYSSLFSPGKIGALDAKNRVVASPLVRNYADENDIVTKAASINC